MKIYFIRHGECVNQDAANYHKQDTGLSRLGKKQTKMACKYLENSDIKIIYSSPKKRAAETAEIISKEINAPIVYVEDISERNKIENPQNSEEHEVYNNYLNYDYVNKSYQTCKDFVDATHKIIKDLVEKHKEKNENVLIVGHSANLYALNSYFSGIKDGKIVWLQCSNCSIIKWEIL